MADLSTEELARRYLAFASAFDEMAAAAQGLSAALTPEHLPEAVLRDITAKTLPFARAIRKFQAESRDFNAFAASLLESHQAGRRKAEQECYWTVPRIGRVTN